GDAIRADVNGRTIEKIDRTTRNSAITDEKGNVTRKVFDESGNMIRYVRADGKTWLFEYDPRFNKVTRAIDPLGNETLWFYRGRGNLAKKIEMAHTTAERVYTVYTYDGSDQLISATIEGDENTESVTASFTCDDAGNLSSITDPMGGVTRITAYNNMGKPEIIQDARGNIWEMAYDALGRLISQKNPLGHGTSFEYDGANNISAVINARLKRFEFEYDAHNNMIKATDPLLNFTAIEYNTDDLPVQVVDREGKRSSSLYDNEGRLLKTTDGAGNEIVYNYDESAAAPALSDLPVRIDYPTYTRIVAYDQHQRITKIADISGDDIEHARTFQYDDLDRLVAWTDEEGFTTRYEYDSLDRITKITDPMGGVVK
ncbi:MAG: RHS repeat protein, partial [Desulfobacterales bacterium]|nr:RHS repeat protein [Desulfobacterales bacterium]